MTGFGRTHGGDHYYWVTSFLAARDLQSVACRLTASCIFVLGAIPPIVVFGDSVPQSRLQQTAALIVAVCCAVMGSVWLRSSWPSRRMSQAFVVIGTLLIAVSCAVAPSALLSLIGAMSYAVLGAFVAFFHSLRLLAFTWIMGALVTVDLAVHLAVDEPAAAAAAVLLIVAVNVFGVWACRMAVGSILDDAPHGDIEPLTGLLSRNGFHQYVATLLGARSRADDSRLVIAVINLDSYTLLTGVDGKAGANRARIAVARALRDTVRRDAVLAHVSDDEFLLADIFTTVDTRPLAHRLLGAVGTAQPGLTASIGMVSTALAPLTAHAPGQVCDEILTIAATAMFTARRRGGNDVQIVNDPHLTVLDTRPARYEDPDAIDPQHRNPPS